MFSKSAECAIGAISHVSKVAFRLFSSKMIADTKIVNIRH